MLPLRLAGPITSLRRIVWLPSLLVVLWLLQSALWTSRIPLPLRLLVAALALTASLRPGTALVVLAFLAPLGHVLVTTAFPAYPFALSEALALAFFAGYVWSERGRLAGAPNDADSLALPSNLFAVAVVASCLVQLSVLQLWHDYPLAYATSFVRFLRDDYLTTVIDPRPWVDGRGFVSTAALLLEGVALLRCSRSLCASQPTLRRPLAIAIVAAGAVAAILGLREPIQLAAAQHSGIWTVLTSIRWSSPALPSLNTAGVYFVLVGFIAAGLTVDAWPRVVPTSVAAIAGLAAFSGMWLTQTRSAIVAGVTVVSSMAAWSAGSRVKWLSTSQMAMAAGLVALAVGVTITFVNPFHVLAAGVDRSLRFRVVYGETGLRMFASAPVSGVGIGQYETNYLTFAPAIARRHIDNAHNYLVWMGAEIGLLGLAPFLWLIGAAFWRSWLNVRTGPGDRPRQLALAGLAAFVITWSIGQPLGVPQAAFTFWIALGLVAAHGPHAPPSGVHRERAFVGVATVLAFLLVIAVSMPARFRGAAASVDLARVSYGFHDAGTADDGRPFRWAGTRLTFFQRSTVAAIDLPLAALPPTLPHGATISIAVNGDALEPIRLEDARWQRVRLHPAPDAWRTSRFWRVDVRVVPIDPPPGVADSDRRIAVGEITQLPAWQVDR